MTPPPIRWNARTSGWVVHDDAGLHWFPSLLEAERYVTGESPGVSEEVARG